MKISWVISDRAELAPDLDIQNLKNIGSLWGSWRTWRSCQTDNVICHDMKKAEELIKRDFNSRCNFYIPNSVYTNLGRPDGVRLYEGTFAHDVDHHEELVAMHLAASTSDIVLLLGFDLAPKPVNPDRLQEHRAQNYRNLVKHAIKDTPAVQWVVIDHPNDLMIELDNLDNLTQDNLNNVVDMLSS